MKRNSLLSPRILLAVSLLAVSALAFGQASEFTVYTFPHTGANGYAPDSTLIADSSGNMYGAASSGGAHGFGAVYELVKPTPPSITWTENVLYSFAGGTTDGAAPLSELTFDSSGNLYGTTFWGGASNSGTVFKLTNSVGTWTESVIYNFKGLSGNDGSITYAGVVFDHSGNLYGVTIAGGTKTTPCKNGCGIVYQLVPPTSGGEWTENIIHTFNGGLGGNPRATPIFDNAGNLYGTADGGKNNSGVVFKMTPPATSGGTWGYRNIYVFGSLQGGDGANPQGLALRNGNLYGVAEQGGANSLGAIFELAHPPAGSSTWTESLLYSFGASSTDGTFPISHVTFDKLGNIWGVTSNGGGNGNGGCSYNGCGTVYELVLGTSSWTETVVHAFPASSKDGVTPVAGLLLGSNGVLFGTVSGSFGATGGLVYGVKRF